MLFLFVPLFVQFSISILHLEFFFSLLILGICNFKSECSIFQNGTSIFGIGTFYFSKNVLNNPIISRHNKLDKFKCVFKNPVNYCHLNIDYNFCKRFPQVFLPLACLQHLILIHEFNQESCLKIN